MNVDDALANAVRLLEAAEGETDRALSELWGGFAYSWIALAVLLNDRESV